MDLVAIILLVREKIQSPTDPEIYKECLLGKAQGLLLSSFLQDVAGMCDRTLTLGPDTKQVKDGKNAGVKEVQNAYVNFASFDRTIMYVN
ncbi:unnamed protein product [Schistosoma mattheei]|uniref:Uncharacterized protein n=1 Tax=Schistosoma mattheei TaxID=31246 RepID=A0A183NHF3_9TREM|nr:unnamed protein product [Schistosoma mattheei]